MIPESTIRRWVTHLTHLLPSQRPLEAFVHHNTLHAFEDQPFHEGVERAARIFGAEPYMAEDAFRHAWREGRILERDIEKVLQRKVADEQVELGPLRLPLRDVVSRWMFGLEEGDGGATLRWRLEETDELATWPETLPRTAFERLSAHGPAHEVQQALWQRVADLAVHQHTERPVRPRDVVLRQTGDDTDDLVNPVLVRWCGAFLDPGHAYWPMTDKSDGFYRAVLGHLSQPGAGPRGWVADLTGRAQLLLAAETSPEACIARTLDRMGVSEERAQDMLQASLLSLPGWPGMFVQLTARPDLAPGPMPPTDVVDFLAIRLLLDEAAARSVTGQKKGPFAFDSRPSRVDPEWPWTVFQAVRLLGVLPTEVDGPLLARVGALLRTYDHVRRRWYWQLAYERRYRVGILDAVVNHWERIGRDRAPKPRAQIVTCIDDREESLRRHLEEISPEYQTLGVAGFFGVAAYVRQLGEPHQRPLCPANVVPDRVLIEESADHAQWSQVQRTRGRLGKVAEGLTIGSDTLFRGGLISLWGWSSLVPLALRILAPRLHGRLTRPREPVKTVLKLEADGTVDHGMQVGFTSEEMVRIVRQILEDMGLTRDFAPLVVVLGHGSRSLNNPHEAAHDCGACGGGRGGPNARAFAEMANRPDVRTALAALGIEIPRGTWFVGGYHNTADDDIELYDLDRVPEALQDALEQVQQDLDTARMLDAHERVRRFDSAPLDLTPEQALHHVEGRAEDLAQPRPEYGHCTNALCLVGRRAWSKGLFLDRRVFLVSYDPHIDPDRAILERLLASVGPVGAGINLEYYFSFVDPNRYGCNTKLPHNITSLLGVMDGHSSDLRTGLPWQMVEIHEPVRLLNVIEARPQELLALLDRQPALKQLVVNRWILVAAFDPDTGGMWFFDEEGFVPHERESTHLPTAATSMDWYTGHREHLAPATIARGRSLRAEETAA